MTRLIFVRALYEQHTGAYMGDALKRSDLWQGSVSSKYYSAEKLLPKFNFNKVKGKIDDFKLQIK